MMPKISLVSAYWAITAWAGFLFSLLLAWHILSPFNFFYAQWYEPVGIGENIAQYGPLNKNRRGFENTTREEHQRLMGELVAAINNGGEGLAIISYRNNAGVPVDSLLTDAEITHLQDVARLVRGFNLFGLTALALLLGLLLMARARAMPMPGLLKLFINMLVLLLLLAAIVLVIGPVKVFYQLHVWLFPAQNQWFFYYEDSLMTTMLKAPVIFGPMAAAWVGVALSIWLLGFLLITKVWR